MLCGAEFLMTARRLVRSSDSRAVPSREVQQTDSCQLRFAKMCEVFRTKALEGFHSEVVHLECMLLICVFSVCEKKVLKTRRIKCVLFFFNKGNLLILEIGNGILPAFDLSHC